MFRIYICARELGLRVSAIPGVRVMLCFGTPACLQLDLFSVTCGSCS